MAIITPNEGERNILGRCLAQVVLYQMDCRLFKSNTTPTATTVWGDLTECDFSGYAAVAVSWLTVTTNGAGRAEAQGNGCLFQRDGTDPGTDNTAYGWCLTSLNSAEGNAIQILAIEKFGTSESFATYYKQLVITPMINLFSEF